MKTKRSLLDFRHLTFFDREFTTRSLECKSYGSPVLKDWFDFASCMHKEAFLLVLFQMNVIPSIM